MLDAPLFGAGPMANPGCYLEFEDGSTQDLFVPSGSQSGYKATENGVFTGVLGIVENVGVESKSTTTQEIDIENL